MQNIILDLTWVSRGFKQHLLDLDISYKVLELDKIPKMYYGKYIVITEQDFDLLRLINKYKFNYYNDSLYVAEAFAVYLELNM